MPRLSLSKLLTFGALALLGAAAHAEGDPEDVIKYRQNVMKAKISSASLCFCISR